MKCKKESTAQKAYLRRQLHRRRLVLFCRIFLFVFFINMLGNERPTGAHRRVYFQFPVTHRALFPADDAGQKHPHPHRRDAL